ncbi:WD repeat-containing protein 20-like [Argiope bruennichi]|uniref:WD repeat-containing protein 20 n=1 Tax=Argiope bruennichi TaxID=94029 RepID=A0A8T0F0V6_ARGBR|nr:WD repeat-containing protein 20-like [Argiope bruennichi]KAF8784717.1 WD repeat-containing protein 20 [Argiope bruennichi]
MAVQCDGGGKDELKTQFMTREGVYKLMTLSEYSRPNRVGFNAQANTPVKVSFVTMPDPSGNGDRICFNVGRELYVYMYKGVKKAADLTKPVDKRVYKGTYPTCHDFNQCTVTSEGVSLLVGFSAGQIQLIDPIKKELSKLYNEERLIDKTKVTCLKWVPGSQNLFLVSHSSGQMYVYKEDLPCGNTPPHYQLFKQGEGFAVYTCKTKSTRNPLYRWVIGYGALNEFSFSPCSKYLATVSQDGFLRIFNYDTMDLVGIVRSFFGGLLCVCWSPDGKYVVTGGEDDLVTVWSFQEKRVVARGHGHKSWVSVVAFDAFTYTDSDGLDLCDSEEEVSPLPNDDASESSKTVASGSKTDSGTLVPNSVCARNSLSGSRSLNITSYRFGSVGQDTQLCLWDLTEDVLKQPIGRTRTSMLLNSPSTHLPTLSKCNSVGNAQANCCPKEASLMDGNLGLPSLSIGSKSATLEKEKKPDKEHKRNFSLASRNADKNSLNKSNQSKVLDDPVKLIGTPICPRRDEVSMLEPLICKKIAHERLTALVFREDCFVIACQEGFVCTWARPGKGILAQHVGSPSSSNPSGGTVV